MLMIKQTALNLRQQVQFASKLIRTNTLNYKLKTEQPSQEYLKTQMRKGGRVDWLVMRFY